MAVKNLIICCDGTWQELSQRFPTNVTRLTRALAPTATRGGQTIPQVIFYDDGVGVGTGVLDKTTRILGGALGHGLDRKVLEAYEFLVLNYQPGDRIYIFGFSRGAYTARSVAGLLRQVWILKRENASEIERAIAMYRDHDKDAVETQRFRRNFCHVGEPALETREFDANAPARTVTKAVDQTGWIQFLGVWDTVGSLGIPRGLPFSEQINGKYEFHDTTLSRFVWNARHAVAIDERRETFTPTLWTNIDRLNTNADADAVPYDQRPYQQTWFPGGHGAVGGGESDGGISLAPLLWMMDGALKAGLAFDAEQLADFTGAADPTAPLRTSDRNVGSIVLGLVGSKDRNGPTRLDEVSDAARKRWKNVPAYRPKALATVAGTLDALP